MPALPDLALLKWLLLALGAFLVGLSKTGIAGVGIVSVALFPLALDGKTAAGTALLVLICADAVAITAYPPRSVRWDLWRAVFPWAAAGVVIGAEVVKYLSHQSVIKQTIGAILLLIVALQLYTRVARSKTVVSTLDTPPPLYINALTGLVGGFATLIANAAGPVMILYLLPRRLSKQEFIGTSAWFFCALNLWKVPFSLHAGMMNARSPILALALLPAAVCGGLIGKWLIPRIEQNAFEIAALVLTALASARLLLAG